MNFGLVLKHPHVHLVYFIDSLEISVIDRVRCIAQSDLLYCVTLIKLHQSGTTIDYVGAPDSRSMFQAHKVYNQIQTEHRR